MSVVLEQELRDLWVAGRGLVLSVGFTSVAAAVLTTSPEITLLKLTAPVAAGVP